MPAKSSDDDGQTARRAFDMSPRGRLAMVALGYIPMLHVSTMIVLAIVVARSGGPFLSFVTVLLTIYLVPPVATRVVRPRSRLVAEQYSVGSTDFMKWWYTAQCQVLYNRIPILEELLRLVPGLYSTWLRLWGAQIGGLVYWSPGLNLFDRSFLEIGDRVVIGADTKICPHYLSRSPDGEMQLVLAPVSIGDDAMVGGSTLLPAGVQIDPGEQTPGFKPMAPFAHFRDGQHVRTTRFNRKGKHD